jgi:excisionase family DNA binding protein
MLTVPQAARRTGRNPETIRRWIRSGRLAATRVGTQFLVDENVLAAVAVGTVGAREASAPYGASLPGPDRSGGSTVVVELDDAHAARLTELAERVHLSRDLVAHSLLSTALDQRDPDADVLTAVLDAIPGAWERAQQGLAEIDAGRGVRLKER